MGQEEDVEDGEDQKEDDEAKERGSRKSEVVLSELDRKLVEMVMYFNVSVVDASER